MLIKLVTG